MSELMPWGQGAAIAVFLWAVYLGVVTYTNPGAKWHRAAALITLVVAAVVCALTTTLAVLK